MESPNTYIFVVGVGRSGTSLLMSMLDCHSAVCFPPETQLITRYLGRIPEFGFEEFGDVLARDEKVRRLDIDIEALRAAAPKKYPGMFPFLSLFRSLLDTWASRQGVTIVGDKAPKYIEVLPILKAFFPDARIVHVIRDPRDVFLSRKKAAWSGGRPDWMQFLAYRCQFRLGREIGQALFSENYHEVVYEELVQHPESTLADLCGFLGIEFDADMLAFASKANDLVFEDEKSWKGNLFGPLLEKNFRKWETELDPGMIGRIEVLCSRPFREGYYERAGQPSALDKFVREPILAVLESLYLARIARRNQSVLKRFNLWESHEIR